MTASERDIHAETRPPETVEALRPGDPLTLPFIGPQPEVRQLIIDNIRDSCGQGNDCEETVEMVDEVFGPNGEWVAQGRDDIPDFWSSPSFLIRSELRSRLNRVYRLVNYRLRADKYPDGYNGHDGLHIDPVSTQTERLLRWSEYGKNGEVLTLGVVAAEGHDLGNIITREGHSLHSADILANMVPSVLQSPGHWRAAEMAMRLHDERALKALMQEWGNTTSKEDIEALRALGPIVPALVIADKTDMGRHRTNQWATSLEVIDRDDHAFVNFFGESEGLFMSEDGKTLTWKVKYRPDINEKEKARFSGLARERSHHDGIAALAPQWLQDAHKEGRSSHFAGWQHKFMSIYKDRMELSALCAFALYPELEYFEVQANDMLNANDGRPRRQARETFAKNTFDEDQRDRTVIFVPKKKRKKLYEKEGSVDTSLRGTLPSGITIETPIL